MSTSKYRKHFIPLESNPEVFTDLIHDLGVSSDLEFEDVFSLDEPDFLPHPALALILIFPAAEEYEKRLAETETKREDYLGAAGSEDAEEVVWFKQTIYNACGLYAILHAVANGDARNYIKPNSLLSSLLKVCGPLNTTDRARVLEDSEGLETTYAAAASQGDTAAPEDAEAEVDHHFICFVKSGKNRHLYELNGDSKGPTDTGIILCEDEDVLGEASLRAVKGYIERAGRGEIGFGLMALVSK